jgi:hypothetical protein
VDEEHGVDQEWQNGQEAECAVCFAGIHWEDGFWNHTRIETGSHEPVPNMLTMILGMGVFIDDPDGEPGGMDWI